MKYLALCIMCKNDENTLIENIKYHTLAGVDHFIVYDNMSSRPLSAVLSQMKNVTVHLWPNSNDRSQIKCYDQCLRDYSSKFKWIGFIDTDEFIVLKNGMKSIKDFLRGYESYGGVGLNWKCFGSSGHVKRQESVIESYVFAAGTGDDKHIKSIVNTTAVIGHNQNPHEFRYKPGYFCVNELKGKVQGPFNNPPSHKLAQINHYVTRSREDFEAKRKRGGGNKRGSVKLTEGFWSRFQGGQIDTSIKDFINLIKQ